METNDKPRTIRSKIEKEIKDEFILPHLLGPDGPKRQILFKVFDGTKGPDEKANRRNLDSVGDAKIRYVMYRVPDIHFEPHGQGGVLTGSGSTVGRNSMRSFASEHDPSFDGASEAPLPRPYCFGCSSFFHPYTSDNLIAILPIKRFSSKAENMEACSRCKVVTYCGQECQTKDWDGKAKDNYSSKRFVGHRHVCKAFIKDFKSSLQTIISDQTLDPVMDLGSRPKAQAMYLQRLKIWVSHHHEVIVAMARKALDKPIFEWLPEVNVTVITLQEDDLLSPYATIANKPGSTSSQPEIAHIPNTFLPSPASQQLEFTAQFRYKSSIFHIVKVIRTGLKMLHSYIENHTASPPKNTSNPEFDPQELINVGYHPVIFIGNWGQGGNGFYMEHVKISEIMDCDDLDHFSIGRLVALTNRGNLTTLKHSRQVLEELNQDDSAASDEDNDDDDY